MADKKIPRVQPVSLAQKIVAPVTDCSDEAFDDHGAPLPRVQVVSLAQKIVAPVTDCSADEPESFGQVYPLSKFKNLAIKVQAPVTDCFPNEPKMVTALRLTGELDPDESAEATRDRLLGLLQALGEYDKALGGSGLEVTATNPEVGVLAFTIIPLTPSGSDTRLQALAKVLDTAINDQKNHLNQPPSRRWIVEEVRVAA